MPLDAGKRDAERRRKVLRHRCGDRAPAHTNADTDGEGDTVVHKDIEIENKIAREENALEVGVLELGGPSLYACPECHGVLLQITDVLPLRFRCHTGHAYSFESLLAANEEGVEDALWNAIRAIEESAMLMRHIADHLGDANGGMGAETLRQRAAVAQRRLAIARQLALDPEGSSRDAA